MSMMAGKAATLAAAGLLSYAGVAGASTTGQYGGPTSQKVGTTALRIDLSVAENSITSVSVSAVVDHGGSACTLNGEDGTELDFAKGSVRITTQGNFQGVLKDSNGQSLTIRGHVTSDSATGSFEIKAFGVGQSTPTCSSGNVTFDAIAAGQQAKGAKYSGTVGPGYPIVFRVAADGATVDDLSLGIEATCQPGAGDVAPTYNFKSLTITAGTFSGNDFEGHASGTSDSVRITGTFFGKTAVGEVTDLSHIKSLPDCTEAEPFTATAT